MKPQVMVTQRCAAMLDAEAPVSEVARDLASVGNRLHAGMAVTLTQAAFLGWLAGTCQARRMLEVGTFVGLATLCLAEGAGPEAHVDTFEITEKWLQVAQTFWTAAHVQEQITAHLSPVQDWTPDAEPYDVVFLDGDKTEYVAYYEQLMPVLRPGGVLVADDTLWPHNATMARWPDQERGIDAFNRHMRLDARVVAVQIPWVNGMTLARRL